MKKILITGSSGRLGKHLIKALENKGIETIEFDKKYGHDILDKKSIEKMVKGSDVIFHLAGTVDYSISKEMMYKINVEGTKNIVDISGDRKIIFMSSTAVYGKKLYRIPADENTKLVPTDFYGKTKLEAEKIILKNNGISIRSADIYGPGFEEGYFKIFDLIEKNKMFILGNGKNRIQYIYVNDLVNALINAEKYGIPGESYNIAGDDIKTQEELYKLIANQLGVTPPTKHIPIWLSKIIYKLKGNKKMIAYIEKLSADRIFDISKAEKELKWNPRISYNIGIKRVIEEYIST